MASTVLPSSSTPVTVELSAAAAHRSASPGLPARASIKAPCAAIPGYASIRPSSSNHRSQRCRVPARPLAQTGFALTRTMRATMSAFPAAWAWSMAASGMPWASHHVAARWCSSATTSGSRRSSSADRRSRNRWW